MNELEPKEGWIQKLIGFSANNKYLVILCVAAADVVDVRDRFVENAGDVSQQFRARTLRRVAPIRFFLIRFLWLWRRDRAVDDCEPEIDRSDEHVGSFVQFLVEAHQFTFLLGKVIASLRGR